MSWCTDRRFFGATALLTIALVTFHLQGEVMAAGKAHWVLVMAREGVMALVLTVCARWCVGRWPRVAWSLPVIGAILAVSAWTYLTYVVNRSDYPRPGELFVAGEGGTYLLATWREQLRWPDLLLLGACGWGLCLVRSDSYRPSGKIVLAAFGLCCATWLVLGFHVGRPPWTSDRIGCFRQFGALPLVIADGITILAVGADGSGADRQQTPPATLLGGGGLRRIVLLQVESLDLTVLRDPTLASMVAPWLAAVARGGGVGDQPSTLLPLLAQHGAGGSADCEFAVWFGRPPGPTIPWWRTIDRVGGSAALPWQLAGAEVACHSYHGNVGGFFQRERLHEQLLGFAGHCDQEELGLATSRWGAPDHDFLAAAAARIDTQPSAGAWVAHLITFSSHSPFTWVDEYEVSHVVKARWAGIARRTDLSARVQAYLRSIAYVDQVLSAVVPLLSTRCDMLLLYGDHPSGLLTPEYADGSAIVGQKRVEMTPLLIVGATPWPAGEPASHLDLHATLADALLPTDTPVATMGRSLLRPVVKKTPLLTESQHQELLLQLSR